MSNNLSKPITFWFLGMLFLGCGESGITSSDVKSEYAGPDIQAGLQETYKLTQATDGTQSSIRQPLQTLRLIYNTNVQLVVADRDDFARELKLVVSANDGFVTSSEFQSRTANARSGVWVLRVPTDRYPAMLERLTKLGHAESVEEKTQNVTEEYVDLQSRIANANRLEERIIKLVEDRTGKLSDVLEIERELARVRESIEVMEGRLRYLTDKTSLATITLRVREQQDYKPAVPLTVSNKVAIIWHRSWLKLANFGTNLLLICVGLAPWFIVILPAAAIAGAMLRRRLRRPS